MTTISKENRSVQEFIRSTLINNIGHLVSTGNHFLGFGPQTQAIELLGAIIEDEAVEKTQSVPASEFDTQRKSRHRFHNALKLFSDTRYVKYCPEFKTDPNYQPDFDLYANLRSGYAHQMRPIGRISVTTKQEAIDDRTQHLEIDPLTGKLILVSETLFEDLHEACQKVIDMIESGQINHKKAYGNFLGITSYHH